MNDGWHGLGAVNPMELLEARVALHWALQVPAAAGASLLPALPDASHTNLGWDASHSALLTHLLPNGMRAGLHFDNFAQLIVVGASGSPTIVTEIQDRTLDALSAWLHDTLNADKPLARPVHELPDHAVSPSNGSKPFPKLREADVEELGRWFANAHLMITRAVAGRSNASSVRCWPHHFDIASLITVSETATIGIGMSPGDASYPEPYFYVTPWPYPARGSTLPALRSGQWNITEWTGAVLRGDVLVRATAADQAGIVETFIADSIAGCETLLGV